jgi:hypothetical protein
LNVEVRTYSIADLVSAVVTAREDLGSPEYVQWCRDRAKALARAFRERAPGDLSFLVAPEPGFDGGLSGLFDSAVASLLSLQGPFGDYLEAPEAVARMSQRFGERLASAERVLGEELQRLLVAIVVEAGLLVGDETVSDHELAEQGWSDSPPPDSGLDDW